MQWPGFLERAGIWRDGEWCWEETVQKLLKSESASSWSDVRPVLQWHKILPPQMCFLHIWFYLFTLKLVSGDSGAKIWYNICKDNCLKTHKSFSEPKGLSLTSHDRGTFIQKQRMGVRKGRKELPFILNQMKWLWLVSWTFPGPLSHPRTFDFQVLFFL